MTGESLKIKRETLNDKVEQQMRKMLTEGVWQPGEKIPSDGDLAKAFGVSRPTVRMAIQRLSTEGLVTTRAGEGTYAKEFSLRSYLDAVSDLYVTPEMLEDVCAFRKLIGVECVKLACRKATAEDIREMKRACDEYDRIVRERPGLEGKDLQERVRADLDFHHGICVASHNSMYVLAFNAARGAITKHLEMIIPARLRENHDLEYVPDGRGIHRYILDMIQQGDAKNSVRAYLTHVDHHLALDEYGRRMRSL